MSTEKEQQKIPFFARLQVKYAMSYLAILALVLVLNLADSFMGLMNPGLLGTFISILTRWKCS